MNSITKLSTQFRTLFLSSVYKPTAILHPKSFSQFSEYYPDVKWKIVEKLDDIEFPPDRRRLHPHSRTPEILHTGKVVKEPRRLIDYRGPELLRNKLIYAQYGVQALEGGELLFGHLEMLRLTINRKLNNQSFAVWGIESPWKPKTKRSTGKRMGGGKANIHHYVTPVKAGRIVVEMGGYIDWREAYWVLSRVANQLPFRSRFVSQNILDGEAKIEKYIIDKNINPFFNASLALSRNYAGCRDFISPYHLEWGTVEYK